MSGLLESYGGIIEICLIKVDGSGVNKELHTYIKSLVPLRDIAVEITGIKNDTLFDAPTFEDSYKEVIDIIEGAQLIGKQISFDVDILNKSFESVESSYKIVITDCVDLEEIKQKLELRNHSDESIAEKLKLELVEGR